MFLGTGTSVGVPVIGCDCATCASPDPRNKRLRCAWCWGCPRETCWSTRLPTCGRSYCAKRSAVIHTTLFTHDHADHVFGLDDLRLFPYYLGGPMPIYCEEQVEDRIRKSFDYAFARRGQNYGGGVPQIAFHRIRRAVRSPGPAESCRFACSTADSGCWAFAFGNVAYCTDTNDIPPESWPLLRRAGRAGPRRTADRSRIARISA